MRIIFGHQRFGAQAFGGITRYFVELASALRSHDSVQAEIFSPVYVSKFLDKELLAWPGGLRTRPFPGAGAVLGAVNLALAQLLLRRRPDIDVYHETYYSRFDCAPRGAARVVTVFDMIHELFPGEFSALDRTKQAKARAIQRADHIICISRSTQVDLVRILGVPESKTSVVHLGSSLTSAEPQLAAGTNCCPYLLYVGQRSGYKNFDRMLRAYAASSSLRSSFRVLCFGGGEFTKGEQDLCLELGLGEGSVQYVTGNDAVLAAAYSNAAMLVYPSLYEGFGLPPLEAMAIGCPVVCSAASSIPEVVDDAGYYFDPADIDSIRQAMELVAGSQTLQSELRLRGLRRAGDFSWRTCAERTLSVYQHVGKSANAPALRQ